MSHSAVVCIRAHVCVYAHGCTYLRACVRVCVRVPAGGRSGVYAYAGAYTEFRGDTKSGVLPKSGIRVESDNTHILVNSQCCDKSCHRDVTPLLQLQKVTTLQTAVLNRPTSIGVA